LAKIQLLSAVTVKSGAYVPTGSATTADPGYTNMTVDTYATQDHGDNKSLAALTQSGEDANGFDYASLGTFSVDSFILALQNVSTLRAENGAISSRLQFAMEQLEAAKVNLEAANSRITDTDVAQETTRFARYSILTQAGAAMLSQANQSQSNILQMLLL
jgi:flagellin